MLDAKSLSEIRDNKINQYYDSLRLTGSKLILEMTEKELEKEKPLTYIVVYQDVDSTAYDYLLKYSMDLVEIGYSVRHFRSTSYDTCYIPNHYMITW